MGDFIMSYFEPNCFYRVRSGVLEAHKNNEESYKLHPNISVVRFVSSFDPPVKNTAGYKFVDVSTNDEVTVYLSLQKIWPDSTNKPNEWYDNMPMVMFEKVSV